MNSKVKVKFYTNNFDNIIKKLIKNNIYYKNINFFSDGFVCIVDIKYIKKLKKIFNKREYKIIKYYGYLKYKNLINRYYITIISIIISFIIIYILSNMIFEINIDTKNKRLKSIIKQELKKNNIELYKFKKNYNDLESIENKILKNNKDLIEWIEIEELGTTYNIKITQRVKNKNRIKKPIRNIISTKDAIIKKIIYKKGVSVKNINDYVRKNEVIITGNIIKGEDELKDQVSAEGIVYGEVWYLVNVSVPFDYRELYKTDSFNRYYVKTFDKEMTIINYYNNSNYRTSKVKLLDKIYLPFDLYKEKVRVYKYKRKILSEKEAYFLAINKSLDKINITLDKDEYIISKKVLKKRVFRSKISLEVFIKTYENITGTSKLNLLQKGSVKSDT